MNLFRIASRIALDSIDLKFFDWYPGDSYSDGDFAVRAETPHGYLKGEGLIDPAEGVFEDEWELDGIYLPSNVDPELDLPSDKSHPTRLNKFREVMNREISDQLEEWSENYNS